MIITKQAVQEKNTQKHKPNYISDRKRVGRSSGLCAPTTHAYYKIEPTTK